MMPPLEQARVRQSSDLLHVSLSSLKLAIMEVRIKNKIK
jgi:hypothetical protein